MVPFWVYFLYHFWVHFWLILGSFWVHFGVSGGPVGLPGAETAQDGPNGAISDFHRRSLAHFGPKKGKLVFPGGVPRGLEKTAKFFQETPPGPKWPSKRRSRASLGPLRHLLLAGVAWTCLG